MARRPKVAREIWKTVNCNRPAQEIADELGVALSTVYRCLGRVNRAPVPTKIENANIDYAGLDWKGKGTTQLANETGKSKAWLSLMRHKYAPETVKKLV